MIQSILVAVDGSKRAPGVLRRATELAKLYGAKLHLLRAILVPPEFPAAAGGASSHDDLSDVLTKDAESGLLALADGNALAPKQSHIIANGTPWRAILEAAASLDVDLIVLGSHGYGGLDRILGTTAGKVVNHATTDVYIVRHKQTAPKVE